jgi:arylsulfatase A-like enzyme
MKIPKIKYIYLLFIVLFVSCEQKVISEPIKEEKLNVLYIMADDHAYQAISAYGNQLGKLAKTPNIDRLAKEGALMNAAYCTNSICGPSRSSILTGKFSHNNGFYKNVDGGDFDGTQLTFPKLFHENGYQTAVIGKWHLGTTPSGFDYSKVLTNWGGQGTYFNAEFCINGKDTVIEKTRHSTKVIEDDCIDWLSNRDKSKPFMLMYQFKAPHRDWRPDPMYDSLFSSITFPEPESFNDNYEGRLAASENMMEIENHLNRRDLKQVPPPGLPRGDSMRWLAYGNNGQFWSPNDTLVGQDLKKWKYQNYVKDYLKCIAGVDRAVGRVLDYLDENNLTENTLVIYTSDQGFYLGEHGWFDKRWMYEESFKMPLLMRLPKSIDSGIVSNDLIMNVDFAPTMLDFAGINIPEEFQGKSFKKAFEDDTYIGRDAVYYHYYEYPLWHKVQPHYGIRTSRYKLMHFYYSMDEWELYDLKNDPQEMNNIYNQSSNDSLINLLKGKLLALQVEYGDNQTIEEMKLMTDTVIARSYKEPLFKKLKKQ